FELALADGTGLLQGIGEVVWMREQDEAVERPAGMGIRFRQLDPQSRALVFRIVEARIGSGEETFELEGMAAREPSLVSESERTVSLAASPRPAPPVRDPAATVQERRGAAVDSRSLPAGFAEVARALAGERPNAAPDSDPTVRLPAEGPAVALPRAAAAPPAAGLGQPPVTLWDESGEGDEPAAPRGQRRRRRVLLLSAIAVLSLAAGAAALYLFAPGGWRALATQLPGRGAASERTPPSGVAGGMPSALPPAAPAATEPAAGPAEASADEAAVPSPPAEEGSGTGAAATPAPQPTATEASAVEGPFSQLIDLQWRRDEGGTTVVLLTDGQLVAGTFSHFQIGGETPRAVVRLHGVGEPFSPAAIPVQTPEVAGIRVGHHPAPGGGELHVVLDLTAASVEVAEVTRAGNRLLVRLQGGR
ncbi:MAG TPA: hypothetical protein VMT16_02240, partial [Thermoanaerobaculia bacterium]|nr:hypothetical protein [Thermoanaerobaculia bacterium]